MTEEQWVDRWNESLYLEASSDEEDGHFNINDDSDRDYQEKNYYGAAFGSYYG